MLVKAVRQTGGVALLSWLSQKMVMWAESSAKGCASGLSIACQLLKYYAAVTSGFSIKLPSSEAGCGLPIR